MHLALCCGYTQGYPYTSHFYICLSMPIFWSTFTQTLLYSTKCNTVMLHLPTHFVKYAVYGRQLDQLLLLLFFVLAQQPDNGSWTPNPPLAAGFERCDVSREEVSPLLNPKR
jgi:hypothetical protein